ncbi:efflux RND transporter periplasmic adaptor subunit [Pseudomonas sp. 5P_3.1_Bac2]|nr:efflux RND transporter periplasmic adaptor subunit [Pseudomonas sp. 5P_3.1_Bac2]MCU1718106.1 efflux RND transporter periplasmic adaptor subunit [Pseudomonas sp. 5P_3.1_Bac2]
MRKSLFAPRLLIPVALLVAVAGCAWYFNRDAQAASQVAPVKAAIGNIEDTTTALGTLQPLDYVDVGAQVSGQLLKLHVALGEEVKEGQLLAEIDPRLMQAKVIASQAQLTNQRAQLKQTQAQLELAQIQLKRQQALFAEKATSQELLQTAQADVKVKGAQIEALQAQIAQTEAGLEEDRTNLGYTKIYAPMSGTVVSQSAKQGQTLNANQQAPVLVQIANLARMTVDTQVSEADIGKLKVGMPVYFTTLGQTQRWQATLRQILPTPTVTNNVVLYNAQFDVDNPDGKLMTQMSAQVFFVNAKADNVLTIPVAVLQNRRGRPTEGGVMFRLQVLENGKPVERMVKIGLRDRVSAQVLEGIAEGEQLAATQPVIAPRPAAAEGQGPGSGRRMGGPRF